MMKLLVTGDLHFRASNPRSRLDDYPITCIEKLQEIFKIAKDQNVSAIIIPGDLFDTPNISYSGFGQLATTLSKAPCRIFTVPGNHDIYGHNLGSTPRTPYGLLEALGIITCVSESGKEMIVEGWDGVGGFVSGHGFNAETDHDLMQYSINIPMRHRILIHITHGMLLVDPPPANMPHTLVADLEAIPVDRRPQILINGHYHLGLPLTRIGDTLIINPGAITRVNASREEMARTVQVAMVTIEGKYKYDAEFIPLKSARPAEEVLSREHLEEAKERNQRLTEFLRLLGDQAEAKFMEVREIIEDIARMDGLPEEVKAEAIKRINEAKEKMDQKGVVS